MFELNDCLAYTMTVAAKKLSDAFNKDLMERGTTRVQWIALYYMGKYGSISQVELADILNIQTSTLVRLIDRLESEGLVIRKRSKEDRRVTKVSLTDKGFEQREKYMPECENFSTNVTKDITSEEIETFKKVLNKMLKNCKE